MPTQAADVYTTLFKNGTATFLARVVDQQGAPARTEQFAAAAYSVYLLSDRDPDQRTPVLGHDQVPLAVRDVLFDVLQTGAVWTADPQGYNFRHTLDVAGQPAFPLAGRRFLLEYRLQPATGQAVLVRFRVDVI